MHLKRWASRGPGYASDATLAGTHGRAAKVHSDEKERKRHGTSRSILPPLVESGTRVCQHIPKVVNVINHHGVGIAHDPKLSAIWTLGNHRLRDGVKRCSRICRGSRERTTVVVKWTGPGRRDRQLDELKILTKLIHNQSLVLGAIDGGLPAGPFAGWSHCTCATTAPAGTDTGDLDKEGRSRISRCVQSVEVEAPALVGSNFLA